MKSIVVSLLFILFTVSPVNKAETPEQPILRIEKKLDNFNNDINQFIYEIENSDNT